MKKKLLSLMVLAPLAACGGGGETLAPKITPQNPDYTDETQANNETHNSQLQITETGRNETSSNESQSSDPSRKFSRQFDSCPKAIPSPYLEDARCLIGSYTGKEEATSNPCTFELLDDMTVITTGSDARITMTTPFRASVFNKNYINDQNPAMHAGYVIYWELAKLTKTEQKVLIFSFNHNFKNGISVYTADHAKGTSISCIIDED